MSDSIHQAEMRRAAAPIAFAIALLWIAPMTILSVIVAHRDDTAPGRLWSGWRFMPYLLSLCAWKLPATWFDVRGWETTGRVYERIGVRWFKQFMIGGDLHRRRLRKRVAGFRTFANQGALDALRQQSILSEKTHVIMFLFALWPTLIALIWRWWGIAIALVACNIAINVYPVMLQRFTRARIAMVRAKRAKTSDSSSNGDVANAAHR